MKPRNFIKGMNMKIIFILVAITFSSNFLFSQFGGGGPGDTKDNAYQIWTKFHLEELGDSVNTTFDPYNPNKPCWICSKYFNLMTDIVNVTQSIGWYQFYGNFYGNKKLTAEINYDYDLNPYMAPALFFSLCETIDSLILDGFINGGAGIVFSNMSVYGGTAGKITNCINNSTNNGAGIAYRNHSTISHCLNNGSVSGVDFVAGIAADCQNGNIYNCINIGNIYASVSEPNVLDWWNFQGASGIVIISRNIVSNCINLGDVKGYDYVSGIASYVGSATYFSCVLSNCINSGFIKGRRYVGGIVGMNVNNSSSITNCVNTGVIEGEEDVGSIIGKVIIF